MRRIVTCTLSEEAAGLPLVEYATSRFTYHTAEQWRELIIDGRVQVNGGVPLPEYVIQSGDVLEYFPEQREEPAVCWNVDVLDEDAEYLVLNKPANLPCHPAGIFFDHTLWACLKEGRLKGVAPLAECHFVNRLDRETSGILVVAKSGEAAGRCARELRRPEAVKQYRVLVEGEFPEQLSAVGFLGKDETSQVNKKLAYSAELKPGYAPVRTDFICRQVKSGVSLVEATLFTGRTHQIRATLCSLGYPVVGDKLYGVDEGCFLRFIRDELTDQDRARLRLPYQALQAFHLSFAGRCYEIAMPEWWNY